MSVSRNTLGSLVVAAVCISAPADLFAADSTPDPAKQKPYTSFVTTLTSLTTSAADLVLLERSAGRLESIRKALTKKVIEANSGGPRTFTMADALDEAQLLCGFRSAAITVVDKFSTKDDKASITVDHLATVTQAGYLSSVATQIQSVSKADAPGDLLSALQALFASYQVKATSESLGDAAMGKLREKTSQRCKSDLQDYEKAYYGQKIESPLPPGPPAPAVAAAAAAGLPALSFLGPIGVLIDTVLGIITPVVVEASAIVDQVKRDKAVRDFLSDEDNQKALRLAGTKLARSVSNYTFSKRLILAGTFAEQMAVIRTTALELDKTAACDDAGHTIFNRPADGMPSLLFRTCHRAVWEKLQKTVASALKTASDYDLIADAGDTSTALVNYEKITSDFSVITASEITNPEVFWQFVSQLVSFAGTVASASSIDNRTKIQNAIDALVKGS
jgi:hypothetical protein